MRGHPQVIVRSKIQDPLVFYFNPRSLLAPNDSEAAIEAFFLQLFQVLFEYLCHFGPPKFDYLIHPSRVSEDPPAEWEASGSPLEGGSRDGGFSIVTGGRPTLFQTVTEWGTPWPRAKSRGTAEGRHHPSVTV